MIEYLTLALPKNVVDRADFPVDLTAFERVTGIKKTRRFEGSTWEMIREALDACGFEDNNDIDGVIVVTQSPDRLSPCMAMEVHRHLGLSKEIPAIDVNHACDGWIMGLYLANNFSAKTLLICADRLRYNKTPAEGLIFSDSVSITVVTGGKPCPTQFYTNGVHANKIYCGMNGEMDMDGDFVFDFVTTKLPAMIKSHQQDYGGDILVPHQANLSMNKLLATRSGFKDSWFNCIEEYGNQSMNSVPMAVVANEEKALGKKLLLCGFGAGMSAAFQTIKWPEKSVCWKVEI